MLRNPKLPAFRCLPFQVNLFGLAEAEAALESHLGMYARLKRHTREQQTKLEGLSREQGGIQGLPSFLQSQVAAAAAGVPLSPAMQHLLATTYGAEPLQ